MSKENTQKTKKLEVKPIVLDLPELGDDFSDYTGETTRVRLDVPILRVSYKSEDDEDKVAPRGEFVEYDPSTKKSVALGKKVTIQILHHRQSLSSFKPEESYYTPEVSMKTNRLPLFMRVIGKDGSGKSQFCGEDDIKNLRQQYPDLRYNRNLYVYHDGLLKKLTIYGASFANFIQFTKDLKGQSSASVVVELTTTKEKNGNVVYYPIVFTIKEKVVSETIKPVLKQLSDWFVAYDKKVADDRQERTNQAAVDRGDGPVNSTASPVANLPPAQPDVKHDFTAPADPSLFDEKEPVSIEEAEAALGGNSSS